MKNKFIKNLKINLQTFLKLRKKEKSLYQGKGKITGFPSIDLPQSKESTYFEKNPFIPSVDMITILKLLSRKTRDAQAIDCNELKATYQELIDDSHTLCKAFRELGVKKGDIITVSLPSNYQAICIFFALNELGAITTYIDTYCSEAEILTYLKKYNSPILINYDKTKEENDSIQKQSGLKRIITLDKEKTNSKNIFEDYENNINKKQLDYHTLGSLAARHKTRSHIPNTGNTEAMILYTSGSTGQPKGVVLTNKNILSAQLYAGNTSHTENITGPKTMSCVPIRYPYGMVTSVLTSLLWGKEVILTPDWDSKTVEYYYKKNPNIVFGSPALLDVTMKFIREDMDLSQVSHFISGGDFLTIEHAKSGYEFFEKHNNKTVEIGNGFGNAETVSIGSTPVGVPLKQATAGKILVGTTPLVIDKDIPDDRPIENPDSLKEKKYNEIGELCLSGEYIFKKYFGEPYRTEKSKFKRKGKTYFRTGTLGYIDEEGYFTPTDRKSRFYIRSTGHKVYLDNVQRIIGASCNKIAAVACVKMPNEDELYTNKAYIVLKKGVSPDSDTEKEIFESLYSPIITEGIAEQLKEYEIPREIEFVEELPRISGSEKIDYLTLEANAKNKSTYQKTIK